MRLIGISLILFGLTWTFRQAYLLTYSAASVDNDIGDEIIPSSVISILGCFFVFASRFMKKRCLDKNSN
jgi:hypothetical protein